VLWYCLLLRIITTPCVGQIPHCKEDKFTLLFVIVAPSCVGYIIVSNGIVILARLLVLWHILVASIGEHNTDLRIMLFFFPSTLSKTTVALSPLD